jgi:hypothetical protein
MLSNFVIHAAQLMSRGGPADCCEQQHLPEEPMGGRLPQPRGVAVYGTDSRPAYNGTATVVSGTRTDYYGPI